MRRVAVIVGTRPEAIKLAPVFAALKRSATFEPLLISTGQHRDLLDSALNDFGLLPDVDLSLMTSNQQLEVFLGRALEAVGRVLDTHKPDLVVVQGDTTTVLAAALAAFYRNIDVAHVEAGLRTHDLRSPFPEEMNRSLTGRLARWHFAPTERSRQNLLAEAVEASHVHVVGNTVIDALLTTLDKIRTGKTRPPSVLGELEGRVILVTTHRRENFGRSLEQICEALMALHDDRQDVSILLPVHLNPNVAEVVRARLGGLPRLRLIDHFAYTDFVAAMDRSMLILTDSGGIQEEAPTLNKPVLVMRNSSERPEAIETGAAALVGSDPRRIVAAVNELLDDKMAYDRMATARNPFGDGTAARQIVEILERGA